ncbi:MAG: glycosyltransferase family 2 protein [Solirubrobacteraceae bacterium]
MAQPRVTVLVPNYNGAGMLRGLISSLLVQSFGDYRLIVLDDGSSDGSEAYVRRLWPAVEVMHEPTNRGFAATVNRGVRAATSEYVAIVNTDVELEPDWLELLVETLDRHPGAASATGKTLADPDRERLDGAGNQLRWSGGATRRGYGVLDRGQYNEPGEVISACAGFALYRRSAFEVVGVFDEVLVAYYEDVDWGIRAQLAGFSCRYEPRAVAYHVGSATYGLDRSYLRLQRRNQLLVVLKCYPLSALAMRWPQIILGQLVLLGRGVRDGTAGLQCLALVDAVRAAPRFLAKRGEVKPVSRVGRQRLAAAMTPERYWPALTSKRPSHRRGR